MHSILRAGALGLGLLLLTAAPGRSASIDCSVIGTQYDGLFVTANNRVTTFVNEFKALPPKASKLVKATVRNKVCLAGGEVLGLLKLLQAVNDDCTRKGHDTAKLTALIKEQLDKAAPIYNSVCGL